MWARCRTAAQEGTVLGVKYGIAVLLTIWAVAWLLGDYSVVRQRALNGQHAFEYIQRVIQQQEGATTNARPNAETPTSP